MSKMNHQNHFLRLGLKPKLNLKMAVIEADAWLQDEITEKATVMEELKDDNQKITLAFNQLWCDHNKLKCYFLVVVLQLLHQGNLLYDFISEKIQNPKKKLKLYLKQNMIRIKTFWLEFFLGFFQVFWDHVGYSKFLFCSQHWKTP